MSVRCMCGALDCPVCGPAQGWYCHECGCSPAILHDLDGRRICRSCAEDAGYSYDEIEDSEV